ncbi:C4-type zinc ribbon domain-containing protein [Desulfuromonas carbonis]|uniref:zinc ribbon domain-containing protein n=1 Tax=Desulfuromonas sp. DDH964 TaxID=1823759 RepID=UPI00078EA7EB|nr:C4-type zinc ribbon domain-containing protein [Desulfuromonas sp. DDH964]AMV73559.1 Chromosome partition protein Smc [Desulfuromonas sp. DDH964]
MQEELELLKELQELDRTLHQAREKREVLEREQATLTADLDRIQAMVDTLDANLEELRDQRGDLNQALSVEQENIKKAEGRLPAIKTQKEYVAVLKEIDTAKKLTKDLEDRVQATATEVAAVEKDREEKATECAGLSASVEARRQEIAAALAEFDKTLGAGDGRRNELLGGLPTPLRKRYQMLLDRRHGVAVVEARNGTCLGCNMHLPPQLFNSLFTSAEVLSCPHCNRLLFLGATD